MNVSDRDQVLAERITLGRCEAVAWAVLIDGSGSQIGGIWGLCEQLKDMLFGARPSLKNGQALEWERLITKLHDSFSARNDGCG
jgi:hypothetical protein